MNICLTFTIQDVDEIVIKTDLVKFSIASVAH